MNCADYQLRRAAGMYWLLDMKQDKTYHKPVCMNTCGAYIWERYAKGMPEEEIAACLQQEFDLPAEEAAQDISAFLGQLRGWANKNGCK